MEKIFETNKRFARYCAPEKEPYDYWLSEYEDGLNMADCDRFFKTLRDRLVPLLKRVSEKPQVDDSCLKGHFPAEKQKELSELLMKTMGIDPEHCALSTTEHPFTISLGSHLDVRITTHYHEDKFASSLFSVIHEGGHALYDMGSDRELCFTALDGGVSMGIHESQSRFYENLLGRSRAFSEFLFPHLQKLFPSLKDYSPEDYYKAINKAQPSLIRTEADEVTYCLHVMVRYELKKRIMAGELTVHELPAEWNRLYKEYLGLKVPDDRRGVLQNSHWSGGAIGYFPSYALGSAYGAQLMKKMNESVDVEGCMGRGEFGPINEWNRDRIWRHGRLKKPVELLREVLGEDFDPTVYIEYLENKCAEIYGL